MGSHLEKAHAYSIALTRAPMTFEIELHVWVA